MISHISKSKNDKAQTEAKRGGREQDSALQVEAAMAINHLIRSLQRSSFTMLYIIVHSN